MEKKVIEKIRKLLALTKSDNKNEAELAAAMSSELMTRHNISMLSMKEEKEKYIEKPMGRVVKKKVEEKFINGILREFFFVRIMTIRYNGYSVKNIIGNESSVQVAEYVHEFLEKTFRDLWKQYKAIHGASARVKQQYYYGLYQGLSSKLEAQKQEIKRESEGNCTALVVCEKELDNFVDKNHKDAKTVNQKIGGDYDATARARGIQDGKNININRGIKESENNSVFLLTI